MLDVQRERLKHMLANAILELWKKETGSLSPVIIEGTICITAGSGRTTVVQVSNHFSGSIPDPMEDVGQTYHTPKRKMLSIQNPHRYGSAGDVFDSPPMIPAFFQEMSPASLLSPHSAPPIGKGPRMFSTPGPVRFLRNSSVSEQSMDISDIKEEGVSDNDDENDEDGNDKNNAEKELNVDVSHNVSSGDVIPGTGLYERDSKEKEPAESQEDEIDVTTNDPTEEELALAFDTGSSRESSRNAKRKSEDSSSPAESDALDLSSGKKEGDLALSPPQNYTTQVRNVIRQRLLATRQHSSEAGKDTATEGSAENSAAKETSSPNETVPVSPLPPLMNLNLNSSSSMLSMQYGSLMPRAKAMAPPAPIHDMLGASRSPGIAVMSPEAYSPRPSSHGSFDQNGNNKETLYVNDKGESQKVYRCNFCSKTFLFKSKYYEHLPVHTNVRPFQCHLCSRTYKYKYDLRVHLRTHMGIPTKSTVCPFCSVKFDTNKMLRLHIQDCHRGCVVNDQNIMSPTDASPATETQDPKETLSASL